jgi:hypothetical protein
LFPAGLAKVSQGAQSWDKNNERKLPERISKIKQVPEKILLFLFFYVEEFFGNHDPTFVIEF